MQAPAYQSPPGVKSEKTQSAATPAKNASSHFAQWKTGSGWAAAR